MQLRPYWLEATSSDGFVEAGPFPRQSDVVVVGGGFTGLSAASALAQHGTSVTVLEAGRLMGGASGRNGGHCNNGLSGNFHTACQTLGRERAEFYYRTFDAAVDTVERLVREHRINCHFRRCGKVLLASKPQHFEALERAHEALATGVDKDVRLMGADTIGDEVNSPAIHGGLVFERSAQLHVGLFGEGLARTALSHGASVHEETAVEHIERASAGTFNIKTSRGSLKAERVLVATGAYSGQAIGFLKKRILPIGSFIVATEPLSKEQIASFTPTRRNAVTTLHVGNYFRLSHDNRLIFGGRARFALSSPESDRKSGTVLQRRLCSLFPQLDGVKIDYCWGGLVDMTQDRLPHAGQHNGVYYAAGYSGHGVQMSVHMGQVMARVMAGEREANPWQDRDWPAIPLHWARAWFLPVIGLYYRSLDLIK